LARFSARLSLLTFKGQIMVINATYTTWHAEDLDNFYGHDNGGLIHGVYVYDDNDNLIESLWFKTEKQARAALLTV
jgi:hypothetical protein